MSSVDCGGARPGEMMLGDEIFRGGGNTETLQEILAGFNFWVMQDCLWSFWSHL